MRDGVGRSGGGFLEKGRLLFLGSARVGVWLLCEMGETMAAPHIPGAHRGLPAPPLPPPHLTPLIGTPDTEEPTVTAWGLEGSSLRPGQPSPALEDWEGEPVWV